MAQTHEVWAADAINPTARAARILGLVLTEGVADVPAGGWQVQEQASPNMTVRVGSGTAYDVAYVKGDANVGQGLYAIRNTQSYVGSGNTDLTVSPGDATHPRHDLVVLRMYDDAEDSSGQTEALVEIVEGSPAASPVDPSTPDTAIVLGRLVVAANENTAITTADITDLRTQASVQTPLTQDLEDRIVLQEGRLIATQSGDGTSNTITFSNIPQDYSQLKLYGQIGHDGSAAFHNLHITLNGNDSGGDYFASKFIVNGDTGAAGNYFDNGLNHIYTKLGLRGSLELTIPAYTENVSPKAFHMTASAQIGTAAASHEHRTVGGQVYNSGAITSIELTAAGGPDFSGRTILSLVGVG